MRRNADGVMVAAGMCPVCRIWFTDLRRWLVSVVPGANVRLWVCQSCRDLPREVMNDRIRWNIDNLPEGWDDGQLGFAPSSQEVAQRRRTSTRRPRRGH